MQLQKWLNDLMEHEHSYWTQRARIMWLTEGDLNTKYFHQKADNRRRRNEIKGLFNEAGVWCTYDAEVQNIVLNYYGQLFTSSNPINVVHKCTL